MQKFYFRDIEESPTAIDYLEVQSYEMNVYLVYHENIYFQIIKMIYVHLIY